MENLSQKKSARSIKYLDLVWWGVGFFVAFMTGFYAGTQSISVSNQQALFVEAGPFVVQPPTKSENCIVQNGMPDSECTPGAVFPNATREITCVSGYTKTVRKVTVSTKKKIYQAYGIAYPPPFGTYEADHFIPLALGGSNEIANLFPESAEPRPGFKEKDLVENYLHLKVCAGEISLSSAQRAIATDWVAVYNSISPSKLTELKNLYKSWSTSGD